jgi:hypothetical protein
VLLFRYPPERLPGRWTLRFRNQRDTLALAEAPPGLWCFDARCERQMAPKPLRAWKDPGAPAGVFLARIECGSPYLRNLRSTSTESSIARQNIRFTHFLDIPLRAASAWDFSIKRFGHTNDTIGKQCRGWHASYGRIISRLLNSFNFDPRVVTIIGRERRGIAGRAGSEICTGR